MQQKPAPIPKMDSPKYNTLTITVKLMAAGKSKQQKTKLADKIFEIRKDIKESKYRTFIEPLENQSYSVGFTVHIEIPKGRHQGGHTTLSISGEGCTFADAILFYISNNAVYKEASFFFNTRSWVSSNLDEMQSIFVKEGDLERFSREEHLKQRCAILSDSEITKNKVLENRIENFEEKIENRLGAFEVKMENRMGAMENRMEAMENRLENLSTNLTELLLFLKYAENNTKPIKSKSTKK